MKLITLKIDGMRCYMCEDHINNAIRKSLPKAKKVKANHIKGEATFILDENEDYSSAIQAIEKDGYRVLDEESSIYEKKGFFSFLRK